MHGKLIMPEASLHKDYWHTVKDVNPFIDKLIKIINNISIIQNINSENII